MPFARRIYTVDNVLTHMKLDSPRLVSITSNGAERGILKGMSHTIAAGCPFISLAVTGKGYSELMEDLGYEFLSHDDHGYTFHKTS